MKLEITELRKGYIVRPEGKLGTIGWTPKPWSAQYFSSRIKAQQYINQVEKLTNEGKLA